MVVVVATAADRFARCQKHIQADVALVLQPPSLPTSHHRQNGGARFHLVDYEEEDAQLIAQYYKCPQPVYEASTRPTTDLLLRRTSDTMLLPLSRAPRTTSSKASC